MNGDVLRQKVLVTNPQGFHLRPIAAFAELAQRFRSRVTVAKNGRVVDGKSALELMLLAALQGEELVIEASGPDAEQAVDALTELLNRPPEDAPEAVSPPTG
ncbi:MAG TPA: HPr family phosphocarrier protein [Gemmataceae bacterium]|nr:HPr family phosphocarrier protein [Gemmataceae bacterium]